MIIRKIFSLILILASLGISLILPGCEVDYYQPSEDNQGTGSSLFEDGVTVPAGFDWATIKAGKLTVTVDDRFNGKYYYQVEVFDTNPIFSPQARLLAKGVAKQGQNWVGAVDFPSDLEAVYVRQTSPTGQGVVKTVSISGENLSVDFTPKTGVQTRAAYQSQESSTVSMRSTEGPSTTYPTPAINGTSVFELSGEGNKAPSLWTSHAYVIPAGKTFRGSFDFNWTNSFIYIEGTWENTSANIELRGWTVIVQNGGKFINNADGGTFKLNSSSGSQLIVAAGGEFGKEGKLMTLSQDGDNDKIINSGTIQTSGMSNIRYLYNYGDINLSGKMNTYSSSTMVNKGNFIINNGTGDANALSLQGNFQNEGTVKISGTLNFPSNTFVLTNTGFFEVHTLGLSTPPGAQGTINNDGQFLITNEAAFELTFNIGAGGLLEARNLTMLNSTITLADNAMLTVTGRLTVSTSGVAKIIRGPAAGNALAKINEVAVPDYTNFELQGELEVECSNYQELPGSGTSDKGRTTGEDVRFVKVGESTVIIPASEYNKGGNDTSIPDTPPASPRFPIISEGLGLTYLFEDNWPYLGDYDMNDVVLDVQPIYETNEQNKVIQLTLQVTLRAAGASKRLAVGIQLDGITPGMISSITRSNTAGINGNVFTQSNGLETGQTYAVIPAFDDAHEALGHSSPLMTNTVKGSENNVSPRQVDFTIHFTTPLDQASISIDKLNAFIINGGYKVKRQEVHMAGFQPTDKADKSKFGLADDNSTEKPYTSKSNMIWGLAIPGPAKYPLEWTSIKVAYSGLENWATSGGALEKDWYKNPNQNIVYDK